MTAPATTAPAAAPAEARTVRPWRASLRRVAAVSRAEVRLLLRNRTLLLNAALLPVGVVALLATTAPDELGGREGAATVVGLLAATLLLLVVYYTVLSTAVARRDAGVLQRLRTGELTDAEILTSLAAPAVAVTVAQTVVLAGLGAVVLGLPAPGNAAVVALGLGLGCLVFAVLAQVTTIWSRNLEAVQVTSLPVISVCAAGAGMAVPGVMPETVRRVAEVLPLSPVVELVHGGWVGSPSPSAVLLQTLVLLAWAAGGAAIVRARFPWSPRA